MSGTESGRGPPLLGRLAFVDDISTERDSGEYPERTLEYERLNETQGYE